MAKSIVDYIAEESYERYNELLNLAEQAKANKPKVTKPRGPMAPEQKKKMAEGRLAKAQAALEALLASEAAAE